jgi:hypothetical protein
MGKLKAEVIDTETGEIKKPPGTRVVLLPEIFELEKFLKARGIGIYEMPLSDSIKFRRREIEIENERYERMNR